MEYKLKLLVLPAVTSTAEVIDGMSRPIELTKGKYDKVDFCFMANSVKISHDGVDLRDFDFVWLSSFWESRDLAYAIMLYLDFYNVPHTEVEKSTSKITDQVQFSLNNISSPNTFFKDSSEFDDVVLDVERTCGYPLIMKDTKGSMGKFSAFASNRQELFQNFQDLPKHRKYFFQEYILNDYDWGVLIADGKIVSAEKSFPAEDEFRNNACNGAVEKYVELFEIPSAVKNVSHNASSVLGLDWSRVDIIIDKETKLPYVMEVNRSPGVTSGTTDITGARNFIKSKLNSADKLSQQIGTENNFVFNMD